MNEPVLLSLRVQVGRDGPFHPLALPLSKAGLAVSEDVQTRDTEFYICAMLPRGNPLRLRSIALFKEVCIEMINDVSFIVLDAIIPIPTTISSQSCAPLSGRMRTSLTRNRSKSSMDWLNL